MAKLGIDLRQAILEPTPAAHPQSPGDSEDPVNAVVGYDVITSVEKLLTYDPSQ